MVPVGESLAQGVVLGIRQGLQDAPFAEIISEWYKLGSLWFRRPIDIDAMFRGPIGQDRFTMPGKFTTGAARSGGGIMPGYSPSIPKLLVGAMSEAVKRSGIGIMPGYDPVTGRLLTGTGASPGGMKSKAGTGLPTMYQGVRQPGSVDASAFRTGKGGFLAVSKANYWKKFVEKWGIPTEESARKTAAALGIPLPSWLEQVYSANMATDVSKGQSFTGGVGATSTGSAVAPAAGMQRISYTINGDVNINAASSVTIEALISGLAEWKRR
jgi:hypothetical protein